MCADPPCIVWCVQDDMVRKVGLSRYSKVSRTAFGLQGKQRIAVLRCGGAILGEWPGWGPCTIVTVSAAGAAAGLCFLRCTRAQQAMFIGSSAPSHVLG
jgi:hypothetical protein